MFLVHSLYNNKNLDGNKNVIELITEKEIVLSTESHFSDQANRSWHYRLLHFVPKDYEELL